MSLPHKSIQDTMHIGDFSNCFVINGKHLKFENYKSYLFDCRRYIAPNTIQTTANNIAAVSVSPARTGDIGIFVKFD